MGDDDSNRANNAISVFLNELSLPKLFAGEAGKAISRLVGKVFDIPAAKLDAIAQKTKDKTAASSMLSDALAKAAAERAVADPIIVSRALDRLLADETRKQSNRESVAMKATEYLDEKPLPEDVLPVDEDWLDYFSSHAEKANSEKMRDLWARVLAGEIRKAGSYSIETMRFMSELDKPTAQIIEKYFARVFRGRLILDQEEYHKSPCLTEVTTLENKGLLNGVGGLRNNTFEIDQFGKLIFSMRKNLLLIDGVPETKVKINSLILTRLGAEVLSILDVADDVNSLRMLVPALQVDGVEKVHLWTDYVQAEGRFHMTSQPELLWQKQIL